MRLIEEYQGGPVRWFRLEELTEEAPQQPAPMRTLAIQGGKKDKLRPGDLLGALTGEVGLEKVQVGKINVGEFITYVALERSVAERAFSQLSQCNIKGRRFKMRFLSAI